MELLERSSTYLSTVKSGGDKLVQLPLPPLLSSFYPPFHLHAISGAISFKCLSICPIFHSQSALHVFPSFLVRHPLLASSSSCAQLLSHLACLPRLLLFWSFPAYVPRLQTRQKSVQKDGTSANNLTPSTYL